MEAIKPRQIINYDAGIVLIDLHQLNVKTTSDNTNQRHWIRGNLMSTKNRTHQNNNPQHPLSNQMIEQINIALEQKRVEFLSLGHWSLPSETNVREKRAYTSIKSDEREWTSRVLPLEQDDIIKFALRGHCSNCRLQFYHFPDSDRLRVGSVTD